mmetsp:Transcript_18305/g.60143  ORF Transcript_18305/g.60143 Transcript_18305/m.60143 type:complete len:299 (-) Transcript_18305:345-1241(-)
MNHQYLRRPRSNWLREAHLSLRMPLFSLTNILVLFIVLALYNIVFVECFAVSCVNSPLFVKWIPRQKRNSNNAGSSLSMYNMPTRFSFRRCRIQASSWNMEITPQASETMFATVGGGCFWCTEAVFLRAKGVIRVRSGYAGGKTKNPSYRQVVSGKTGHAEVVRIEYDPTMISLRDIFDLHLLSHDPTQKDRQGADIGSQYRSIIFYETEEERNVALEAIQQAQNKFNSQKLFGIFPRRAEIMTEVKKLDEFFEAETYHQDYYNKNPNQPYSIINIVPKLQSFEVRQALGRLESRDGM